VKPVSDRKYLELRKELKELKSQREADHVKLIAVENFEQFIQGLGQSNRFRRPLVGVLSQNIPTSKAAELFGVSDRTIRRARSSPPTIFSDPRLVLSQTHDRIDDTRLSLFRYVLDHIMPFKSGEDYRYKTVAWKELYGTYRQWAQETMPELQPLGKRSFMQQVQREPYRNLSSLQTTYCPSCRKLNLLQSKQQREPLSTKELQKLHSLQRHPEIARKQRVAFRDRMKALSAGRLPEGLLILIQDFTGLEFGSLTAQSHIIVQAKRTSQDVSVATEKGMQRNYFTATVVSANLRFF
jgi:hypothetical protein